MTFTEYASRVAALGYRVSITSYGAVEVKNNSGQDLVIVYNDVPYDFWFWAAWSTKDWGSEAKRMQLTKLAVQFASTAIKNRGKIPNKFVKRAEA